MPLGSPIADDVSSSNVLAVDTPFACRSEYPTHFCEAHFLLVHLMVGGRYQLRLLFSDIESLQQSYHCGCGSTDAAVLASRIDFVQYMRPSRCAQPLPSAVRCKEYPSPADAHRSDCFKGY